MWDLRSTIEARLLELGEGVSEDVHVRSQLVSRDVHAYSNMINNCILGKYDPKLQGKTDLRDLRSKKLEMMTEE